MASMLLAACSDSNPPGPRKLLTGEVTEIKGSLPRLLQSTGALFGNSSVKLDDKNLFISVQVEGKNYLLDIDAKDLSGSKGPATIENLAVLLKVGSVIIFPTTWFNIKFGEESLCNVNLVCRVDPDDIALK